MNYESLFKNKKITLMGLGLLGRGVGDAIFFAKAGADLTVTDLKNEADLATSVEQLRCYPNVRLVLGGHRLEDFQPDRVDLIVKAAGVPLDSPFILEAEKNGIPVVMSTALFAEYTEASIIGVTGTRGKSTVAYLLQEILRAHAAKTKTGRQVFLGGNILGVSTLDLLNKTGAGDTAVLELDSWQLQGFGGSVHEPGFSPALAIFTTFMPDHMNYYKNDMERYFADKANIYRFQESGDTFVVSEQVLEYIEKFGPKPKGKVIVARAADVPDSWQPKILGEHNRLNIALALAAAKVLGVPERTIEEVVEAFKAPPGRLETIRTLKGVEFFNDTNGTTPAATIAALEALETLATSGDGGLQTGGKKTVLIFGGADKKLDPMPLVAVLENFVKAAVVLPGTGTDMIKPELEKIGQKIPMTFVTSMNEAVEKAVAAASVGDRILMSPAFASFGLFKNEYDRGDQFNAAVKAL